MIWAGVDRLIDSTSDLSALREHRVHLLAANRWRRLGKEVPLELEQAERLSMLVTVIVPKLLARVRNACDGPLVLHKGPELARRYPDPTLRPYTDLDLLVPDAARTQRELVASGFVEVGDPDYFAASPHALPLEWPGLPLLVEIHHSLNWPRWGDPPPFEELLEAAVPGPLSIEVDGMLTLPPEQHALVVAAHTWAHGPMTRLRDLIDVALLAGAAQRTDIAKLARSWGIERLWETTSRTADALFLGEEAPLALRLWARNLAAVRVSSLLADGSQRIGKPIPSINSFTPTAHWRVARRVAVGKTAPCDLGMATSGITPIIFA